MICRISLVQNNLFKALIKSKNVLDIIFFILFHVLLLFKFVTHTIYDGECNRVSIKKSFLKRNITYFYF